MHFCEFQCCLKWYPFGYCIVSLAGWVSASTFTHYYMKDLVKFVQNTDQHCSMFVRLWENPLTHIKNQKISAEQGRAVKKFKVKHQFRKARDSKAFTETISSHCSSRHQQHTESISAITCMPAMPPRDTPPLLATSPLKLRTSISVGQTLGQSPTRPLGVTMQEVPRYPSVDLIVTPSPLVNCPVAPGRVSPPSPILQDWLPEGGTPQVPSPLPHLSVGDLALLEDHPPEGLPWDQQVQPLPLDQEVTLIEAPPQFRDPVSSLQSRIVFG